MVSKVRSSAVNRAAAVVAALVLVLVALTGCGTGTEAVRVERAATAAGSASAGTPSPTVDGYRGIWFTLGQFSDYGDKYSGGLGTYTSHHVPMAVYAPAVERTFFTYGGTPAADRRARAASPTGWCRRS